MITLPFQKALKPLCEDSEASQSIPEGTANFWYSRRELIVFLIVLILLVLPISRLTPPLQSPDEFNHIKRAYLLSKGRIIPKTTDDQTGGDIDSGLLDYMYVFQAVPYSYQKKVTQNMLRESKKINWSGEDRFSDFPNTAVYFPISYLPQAGAFFIGKHSGLSVNDSYYLARVLSLATVVLVLWAALCLYPVPLPVIALFATPMVIFQLGSASLDATSFAMCVLAASLFMRAADHRSRFSKPMHFVLIICLLLLSTARTNLLGVIWIPFVLYKIRRDRSYLVSTCILLVLAISWVAFVTLTVKGAQIHEISPGSIVLYYLRNIGAFFSVMFSTLTNGAILLGYWEMFVGVLGWVDTPLDSNTYLVFAVSFVALAVLSAQTSSKILLNQAHVTLAVGSVAATLLIFVLFLATYTLHPAKVIGAVQGRYFYPTAILLGFVFFDRSMSSIRIRIGITILLFMAAFSIMCTVPKLIGRYWIS